MYYKMEINCCSDYLIYDDGRVFSKKRNKFLTPHTNKKGYVSVSLSINGKVKYQTLHRLVGIHYIANPYNYPQIDHIDGNKQNNHVSNLRWLTNIQNNNSYKNNKSRPLPNTGHRNVYYEKGKDRYYYNKIYYGKKHKKHFKSKIDCLCYKYIALLKMKSGG